jgi:hypothetical protein
MFPAFRVSLSRYFSVGPVSHWPSEILATETGVKMGPLFGSTGLDKAQRWRSGVLALRCGLCSVASVRFRTTTSRDRAPSGPQAEGSAC